MPRENFSTIQMGSWNRLVLQYDNSQPNKTARIQDSTKHVLYEKTGYRVSSRTPGFNDPNRTERLKPLPFEFYMEEKRSPTGHAQRTTRAQLQEPGFLYSRSYGNTAFVGVGSQFVDKTPPQDLADLARNKLLGKIKDSSVNLGVVYGERQRTADLVGSTAANIASAYRNLRRGNFTKAAEDLGVPAAKRGRSRFNKDYAKRGADAAAGGWLALQYGWKPLLEDIYGSVDAIRRRNESPQYVTTTKRQQRLTPEARLVVTKNSGLKTTKLLYGFKRTDVKYGVTYYKAPSPARTMAQLGISNPLLVAWELVPYSFVVDWFLPVGGYLEGLDATNGLEFYSGYRTLFSLVEATEIITSSGEYNEQYTDNNFTTSSFKEVYVNRATLSAFPTPAFPPFKNPVSKDHLLNGLALLVKSFRK